MALTRCKGAGRVVLGLAMALTLCLLLYALASSGYPGGIWSGPVADTAAAGTTPSDTESEGPCAGAPEAGACATGGGDETSGGQGAETNVPEQLSDVLGADSDELANLLADAGVEDVPASMESRGVAKDVQDAAADELAAYEALGTTALVRCGWLDLLGRSWGCVVAGPGWVELCVVTGDDEGESLVSTVRMEAGEWEESYAEEAE